MRFIVVFLCAVVSLIGVHDAVAYIIHVPGDYPTIQEGIDHAWNGDTVLVAPDTYYEHINFNGRNLVLGSLFLTTGDTSYISVTIIDGSLTGTVITFNSNELSTAEVVGFTIQHGSASDGGGISCQNSSSPTIRRNVIRDNTAWRGGGIDYWGGSAIVEYNIFFGNHADQDGGGICTWAAMPTIRYNTFYQNTAEYGGAIYCHSSQVTIEGNVIYNNLAVQGGGMAFLTGTWGTVSSNTIDENQAASGGGIYLFLNCYPSINNSIVTNSSGGGGIWSSNSSPAITYCDVWGNAGGDYSGCSPGDGCISADPVFCDPENENYHLHVDSPCRGSGEGGVDMGALGLGCGSVIVTAGPDQVDSSNTQVSISFYIENNEDVVDTFDLDISDALGWTIDPTHYELTLDTSEVDTVSFMVSIPYAPIGTADKISAIVVSRSDPAVRDSAYLTVTCDGFDEGVEVTPGEDQEGYADSFVLATFEVQNIGVVPDSYSIDLTETQGWDIGPLHYDLGLQPFETDTIDITVNIPHVPLGTTDYLSLLAVSKVNPFARDSASLTVTCNAFVEDWDLTPGDDITTLPDALVTAVFYVQNSGLATDFCYLTISDLLGWDIQPEDYTLALNPGQVDSVFFDIQVPDIPVGTIDQLTLLGVSLTNPFASDSASLNITCRSTTIHVPSDFPTIQGAIDFSLNGDTILVAPGTYYEHINFSGKAILVTSTFLFGHDHSTIDSSIIDAEGSGCAVRFVSGEDSNSVLHGFTLTNGDHFHGGAIYCSQSSPTIVNNVITRNHGGHGGAIYCYICDPIIDGNRLCENFANKGGGIYCFESAARITNNVFLGNSAILEGAAINFRDCYYPLSYSPVVRGNFISDSRDRAAIHTWQSTPLIANNVIVNSPQSAMRIRYNRTPLIVYNTISGTENGILCHQASPSIMNNIIANTSGTGISAVQSFPVIRHNNVWNNALGDFTGCSDGVGDTTWGTNQNGTPCDSLFNICRPPLFCFPDTEDYYLAENSCCLGAGCDSLWYPDSTVDIGAFGMSCPAFSPPDSFSLIFPLNKSFTPREVYFDWETPTDPDSLDRATYDLYISGSHHFPPSSTSFETGLSESECWTMLDYGAYYWKVRAVDESGLGRWSSQIRYLIVTGIQYQVGDFSGNGLVDIGDVVHAVNYLYKDGPPPIPVAAGDVNCDGTVNVGDIVYLVNYLYRGGPPPCEP